MNEQASLVYGQLNQETFNDFVKRLSVEQSGNRPHATANPLFSVQNEKIVWSRDSESSYQLSRIFFCVDDYSSFDNYEEMLIDLGSIDDSDLLQAYVANNDVDTSNLEDVAEAINTVFDDEYEACVMYGNYEWEHVNTHITPEAAHAFIERKKHDYRKLRVYAVSAYWCWEMKAIMDGLVNGSIQYVDKATSDKVKELERQRYVLQSLLAQTAGGAVNDTDVQEALLFGLGDSVKPEKKENPSPFFKGLRWKERESGDTELVLKNELLAIVSYEYHSESRGWYWYSMCREVKLNTLRTNTVFNDMESAQADCMCVISHALTITRGRK